MPKAHPRSNPIQSDCHRQFTKIKPPFILPNVRTVPSYIKIRNKYFLRSRFNNIFTTTQLSQLNICFLSLFQFFHLIHQFFYYFNEFLSPSLSVFYFLVLHYPCLYCTFWKCAARLNIFSRIRLLRSRHQSGNPTGSEQVLVSRKIWCLS